MSTLFKNVSIFSLESGSSPGAPTNVLVEGQRIAAIGHGVNAPHDARIIEGSGHLLMPGLINAHFHSPVNHMKGALPSLPLELFMLYESPALDALRPTPHEAYLRTLLGAMEMIKGGVTAVQDDAFFVPEPTPEIIDAVMMAYRDAGLRATLALDEPELPELEKLPYLGELVSADMRPELARPPKTDAGQLLELYDHLIGNWHGVADGRLRAAVSCSAPQRVSSAYFAALDNLSRKHDLPFYAHMLETKLQRVLASEQPRFAGRSLVQYTADLGLLSDRMNVIHAIWIDETDMDLIARAGATVAHNPISNLRLGSGIMPFRQLYDRGINICLGVDEAIADDAINMWQVIKTTGLIHNVTDPDPARWPAAYEILRCATEGGAKAMRQGDQLGRVAVGQLADLLLIDLDTLAFTPLNDLTRQLVYCENGSSVRLTMIDGRICYEAGQLTTMDEAAIRAEARALFDRRKPALVEAQRAADRWRPAYSNMQARAARQDVGLQRTVPILS